MANVLFTSKIYAPGLLCQKDSIERLTKASRLQKLQRTIQMY